MAASSAGRLRCAASSSAPGPGAAPAAAPRPPGGPAAGRRHAPPHGIPPAPPGPPVVAWPPGPAPAPPGRAPPGRAAARAARRHRQPHARLAAPPRRPRAARPPSPPARPAPPAGASPRPSPASAAAPGRRAGHAPSSAAARAAKAASTVPASPLPWDSTPRSAAPDGSPRPPPGRCRCDRRQAEPGRPFGMQGQDAAGAAASARVPRARGSPARCATGCAARRPPGSARASPIRRSSTTWPSRMPRTASATGSSWSSPSTSTVNRPVMLPPIALRPRPGAFQQPRQLGEDAGGIAAGRRRLPGRQADLAQRHGEAGDAVHQQQHALALRRRNARRPSWRHRRLPAAAAPGCRRWRRRSPIAPALRDRGHPR